MSHCYPWQFSPLFRRYLWGGRRLQSILGKPIGAGNDYAESWEIVDHGDDQSVVTSGPLAGTPLRTLVSEQGKLLFGRHAIPPSFPLLFKFLDANTDLSVQVHPDDARGAQLTPPDLGKTEAWLILHAEPSSRVYAGLRDGCSRGELEDAIAGGRTAECLHSFEPQAGDCLFIPAGTIHALGAGLVVAEIQQASDTTYRLFDWNRVGPDGKPRPLHIEQGLEAIDFSAGPVDPQIARPTVHRAVEQLVACDKFVLNRWRWSGPATLGGDDQFHIVAILDGRVDITDQRFPPLSLAKGDVALLPAGLGETTLHGDQVTLMEIHLPV